MNSVNIIPKDKLIEVKEFLANSALSQLKKEGDVIEFENSNVEFGYLYLRDNDYESLFKVVTDKTTIYFAAQQGRLITLEDNFNEALFQSTIDRMISLHGNWL